MILKRIAAFGIDYLITILYAVILYVMVMVGDHLFELQTQVNNPFKQQLIGLLTLTLPVFLYFYLFESSSKKASLGKQLLHLTVQNKGRLNRRSRKILKRNVLKFLPWEIGHTGVYWIMFYSNKNMEIPIWVWSLLIIPQIIVILYFVTLLLSGGSQSIYDKLAETEIALK